MADKSKYKIPKEVLAIGNTLGEMGYEAYLVGGCVRDLLLRDLGLSDVEGPKDWDIATNARPEEIQKLFTDNVYENQFGTVGVKTDSEDQRFKIIEVTTFRIEGKYTDKRHPDEVKFAKTIDEDLSRRDFTINAMALALTNDKQPTTNDSHKSLVVSRKLADPFGGQDDLKNKIIRTVGNPEERFREDALRLMRAVRFAVELDFEIELNTRRAIEKLSGELEMIAKERIRDEFEKIIMAPNAAKGIILLEELNLLRCVLPELREGLGVGQNKHHVYTVFEHSVRSLDYTAKQNYPHFVRMAALLHDVGKPRSKRGEGPDSTFYQHQYIGERMVLQALDRLRFPKDFIEKVAHLVRNHMFYYNVGDVTPAGVRRFLARVGPENVPDLIKVREADRIGSGVEKAIPYKLRHFLFMIEKVKRDPISPKMLAVRGDDVMEILGIEPGPRVGWILSVLLEEVLDDPAKNTKENLESKIQDLGKLSDAELKKLAEKAKMTKNEFEGGLEEKMKKKHRVS